MTDGPPVGGRYRLLERIGIGGMGRVWLADDDVLHRQVAVKEILLPDALTNEELTELRLRTLREARTAARLTHPNVVRVYDVIYADNRPWIVMEYVASRSLAQVVRDDRPLTPRETARVGIALVDALTAAHAAGVLHRDIKPGNVLLANDGRVMLTDFGLATFDEIGMALTQSGVVHGSPQFISPERALDGTSSPAADMWSLGATLYAAVEGRSPYSRPTSYEILSALATSDPDPMQAAGPMARVLTGLLRRDPAKRMKADEMRARLERIVAEPERGRRRTDRLAERLDQPSPQSASGAGVLPLESVSGSDATPLLDLPSPRHRLVPDPADDYHLPRVPADHRNRRRFRSQSARTYTTVLVSVAAVAVLVLTGVFAEKALSGKANAGQTTLGAGLPGLSTQAPTSTPSATVVSTPTATPTSVLPSQGGGPPPPGDGRRQGPPDVAWRCHPNAGPNVDPVPTSTQPGAEKLPAGWISFVRTDEYRIAIPPGWEMASANQNDCFYDPTLSDHRLIGVDSWTPNPSVSTASAAINQRMADFTANAHLPGYFDMGVAVAKCKVSCADWTYTYDGPPPAPNSIPLQVVARTFLESNGVAYTVTFSTIQASWPMEQNDLKAVMASFAPIS